MHMLVLCIYTLCTYFYDFYKLNELFTIRYVVLIIPLSYYKIRQIQENKISIMAWKVDKRILEEMFIQLLAEKANIIKDHLQNRHSKLTVVANIGPTMATFKLYDLSEEDSLKLHMTLSNLGDIDEQIHHLWQQVNFLLKQYCSHCQHQNTKDDNSNGT